MSTKEEVNSTPAPTVVETPAPIAETVARADYEALNSRLKAQDAQLAKFKEEQKTNQDKELKQRNEWQKLAELKEADAIAARAESTQLKNSYLNDRKFSTVKEACSKAGLRPEALADLELIDLADVVVETTSTGKINVLGSDKFAERLKTLRPHWFTDKPPVVHTGGVKLLDPTGPVSIDDLYAAEKECKKSGDMTKYKQMHQKYTEQRRLSRSTAH